MPQIAFQSDRVTMERLLSFYALWLLNMSHLIRPRHKRLDTSFSCFLVFMHMANGSSLNVTANNTTAVCLRSITTDTIIIIVGVTIGCMSI